ncbi:tetratricopeptide repeat protein [Phormidesmis sp. 146-12]
MRPLLKSAGLAIAALLLCWSPGTIVPSALFPASAQTSTTQDRKAEADRLYQEGFRQYQTSQFQAALATWQKELVIRREIGDRSGEGTTLNNIGSVYQELGQYLKALELYGQALAIHKEVGNRVEEGTTLGNIGAVYSSLGQYLKALEFYQQGLAVQKEVGNRAMEGTTLNNIGAVYSDLGQHPKALEFYQQALVIAKEVGNRLGEGTTLSSIGSVYSSLGQYPKSLEFYERALAIQKEVGNRSGESATLSAIGSVYQKLGQYPRSLEFYERALAIQKEVGNRSGESATLSAIGLVYQRLGQYSKALELLQKALVTRREVGNRTGESYTLLHIGLVYQSLGQYPKALEFYQRALIIAREVGDRSGEGTILNNIGGVYNNLGQYSKALEFYQRALIIAREVGDRSGEGTILNNIGGVYSDLKQYPKALEFYQRALAIHKEVGDRAMEGIALNNIGLVYQDLGQYPKALELLQQSLAIYKEVGNRAKGGVLNNIGQVYRNLGQYLKALEFYQQALASVKEVADRAGEGDILNNIGYTLNTQKQPELAIVFYKQSVNIRETIREDIRKLPRETQQAYAQSVSDTYRSLADLLIQQRRLPEAQAVLELLKLRELRDFTRDAAITAPGIDSPGISLANIETAALKTLLTQFTTVGNFSQKIADCETKNCPDLQALQKQRDQLNLDVDRELKTIRMALNKHYADEPSTLKPEALNAAAADIVNAQPGTVLIYPLVLKDKIQFLLALKAGNGAVTFRPFEQQITADTLFTTIQQLRNQLKTPGDLKALQDTSGKLYDWLIRPLEAELNNPNIKHIVFAPDSITRYIPLAALYDSDRKQYLIQRYSISTITAASKTDTTETVPKPTRNQPMLLAMGASTFTDLPALYNVPAELDAITQTDQPRDSQGIYPGSEYINNGFDYDTLKAKLKTGQYRILHIATHGAFKAGRPEDSYLVPGRGENLTTELIDQLRSYGIGNVHLVVLSACETGVGDRASDGMEIPGISYFFLKNEVKSVMASLWSVNDASTALIMQQFYKHLAVGMTKAEALQQVQQDLISSKLSVKDADALSRAGGRRKVEGQLPIDSLAHPYYWAPFILIGNSL